MLVGVPPACTQKLVNPAIVEHIPPLKRFFLDFSSLFFFQLFMLKFDDFFGFYKLFFKFIMILVPKSESS